MTEIHHPTTAPDSIRYAWRRALNRDYRLTEADRRVLLELESYANPDGTNAHPGNERLAEHLATGPNGEHVSLSSVERALRTGRKLGYIVQTKKGGRRKIGGETVKAASVWRLTMPAPDEATSPVTQMTGDSESGADITRQTAPHHPSNGTTSPVIAMTGYQSLNHQSISRDKRSTVAQARRPEKMPADWMPNATNVRVADELGVSIDAATQAMREWSHDYGKGASNWDAQMGAWLKAYRDDEHEGGRWDGMDYDDVLTRHGVAEGVRAAVEAMGTPPVVEDPWANYTPPVAATNEVLDAEVVEEDQDDAAQVLAGPGITGYSREVEAVITKVERMTPGHLTRDERVQAAELASQGVSFAVIAGEIEMQRDRMLVAA